MLIDGHDLDAWRAALATPTKLVFFETPSNPLLELVDIAAVSKLAHEAGAAMSAFNAWVMLKSLETFALRYDSQSI